MTHANGFPNTAVLGYLRAPTSWAKRLRACAGQTQPPAVFQSLCDAAGTHLWMDVESFVFRNGVELHPRPIEGLISDFRRFPNFERILHYQFPGRMSSPEMSRKPGGEPSVKLYLDYKKWLEGKELGTEKH